MSVNADVIKEVVEKTIKSIESSKEEIYNIVENAQNQVESIRLELAEVQALINDVISQVDKLEAKDKLMRQKLVLVSRSFTSFSEKDVQEVYEKASEIRIAFRMKEQEEKNLRARRSSLEVHLKKAEEILRTAEKLIGQVSVAMNFLSGELGNIQGTGNEGDAECGIQMLVAIENEKRKLSREIHDGPAQSIANIVMKADICKAVMKRDVELGFRELDDLKESVRSTLQEIRHIIYELRPGLLEDKGLIDALEELIADFKRYSGCEVYFRSKPVPKDIDSMMEVAVFRLIQETLNNIKKHARAKNVDMIMVFDGRFIDVRIKDDGVGFETKAVFEKINETGASYGLRGMKERVNQLYGDFSCQSQTGMGTEMAFRIPINKEVMLDVYRSN